ncbi:MAG: DUF4199 domain-containing protein [Bacteroidota bacterium]
MNTEKNSIGQVAFIAGLFTFLGMVLYFILMKFAGFVHIPELRFLNVLIAAAGGVGAIKYYNNQSQKHIKYLTGLSVSFITIIIGSVLFAAFVFSYFKFADPELLNAIRVDTPVMGINITPLTAAISVVAEGLVSGLLISFIAMQYYKDDTLHAPYKSMSGQLRTEED